MKNIEFEGKTYYVPDWANYISKSSLGTLCIHEKEPTTDGKMVYMSLEEGRYCCDYKKIGYSPQKAVIQKI